MKKTVREFTFLLKMIVLILLLLFANFVIYGMIKFKNGKLNEVQQLENLLNQIQIDNDTVEITASMQKMLDQHHAFVIIIDYDGKVINSYQRPSDVPTQYTLQQVASFSRWYLNDYPVLTKIKDKYLLVIGTPKNSQWKYNITFPVDLFISMFSYFPLILIIDFVILIFVAKAITKKDTMQKEKERTDWISGVSHDIRTPLAIALLQTSSLKNSCIEKEKLESIQTIEKNILNVKSLIENLNIENHLKYGNKQWKSQEIILSHFLQDMICEYMNQPQYTQYSFSLNVDEHLKNYTIHVDTLLLKRLLYNLINNSIVHNPKGCQIQISLCEVNNQYQLIIQDDGIGINQTELQALNQKSTTSEVEHHLGLQVVNNIARKYHWKVIFTSNLQQGFQNTIVLKKKIVN